MEEVLLDRARGYVVSASDPVTGGAHCAVGGGPSDFLVTSTLASQAPPAVGRALGNSVAHALGVGAVQFPKNFVSYV
jgi:2-oxoisovalerate dehydrogenase E1 component